MALGTRHRDAADSPLTLDRSKTSVIGTVVNMSRASSSPGARAKNCIQGRQGKPEIIILCHN